MALDWSFGKKTDQVWTDEKIKQLTIDWHLGFSASVIGKRLGVSRNAVIGKARRIGLTPRQSPIRRKVDA